MHNLDQHHSELCHQTLNAQQLNSKGMERNVVKENGGTVLYDANAVHMYCFDVYIISAAIINYLRMCRCANSSCFVVNI